MDFITLTLIHLDIYFPYVHSIVMGEEKKHYMFPNHYHYSYSSPNHYHKNAIISPNLITIYIYIWTIYVDFGIHISSPEALLRSAMTSPLLPLKELKVALPLAVTWRMGSRFLPVVVKLPVLSTRHRDFLWIYNWLVVWNMNFMTFHILGIVIPTDFHIFQRGRYTTNQIRNMAWVLGISDISQELWMIYGWQSFGGYLRLAHPSLTMKHGGNI